MYQCVYWMFYAVKMRKRRRNWGDFSLIAWFSITICSLNNPSVHHLYSIDAIGYLCQPPKVIKLALISPTLQCCFALLRTNISLFLTLKKKLVSEPRDGWRCGVPRASRCMDSAVACHFGDNWSALRDRCLSATAGLHGCQEYCWVRESVVTHPGHIQYEKSLSLSAFPTVMDKVEKKTHQLQKNPFWSNLVFVKVSEYIWKLVCTRNQFLEKIYCFIRFHHSKLKKTVFMPEHKP